MKLIIENTSTLSMQDALVLAVHVVKMGRVSNKNRQYCFATVFDVEGEEIAVYSDLNKKSDKLTIANHFKHGKDI